MVFCIWQKGYKCKCNDKFGTDCPHDPGGEGVEKPDAELAPALGRLFSFKSDTIATKDAIERRRAILLGCGLLREEAEVKLAMQEPQVLMAVAAQPQLQAEISRKRGR